MAAEDLVNILVHTDVTRYLEFKQISGSYVYRDGKIAKVRPPPALDPRDLHSPLTNAAHARPALRTRTPAAVDRDGGHAVAAHGPV